MPSKKEITLRDILANIQGLRGEMNERFDGVDRRLDSVEYRLDKVEIRLNGVEKGLDRVEWRLEFVHGAISNMDKKFTRHTHSHNKRIVHLEKRSGLVAA